MRQWLRDYSFLLWIAGVSGLLIALLASSYIAHQPKHESVMAGDGHQATMVTCSEQADCFREAAKVCAVGYATISSRGEHGQSTTYVDTGNNLMMPMTTDTYTGTMLIRCKQ